MSKMNNRRAQRVAGPKPLKFNVNVRRKMPLMNENKAYDMWKRIVAQNQGRPLTIQQIDQNNIVDGNDPNIIYHSIRPLVTYESKNKERKNCKYGSYTNSDTVKCLRNPSHHKQDNPDRRKQNGNQYTRPKRAAVIARRSARLASKK